MSKKIFLFLAGLMLIVGGLQAAPPDEGMWLPLLVKRLNYEKMQKMGCKLTAEEIYSVNKSSLKDAIVQLGGFCTAEVVSNEGLLFTNHHCAYDAIATHSTPENDYLTDGFWAMSKDQELHTPGLTANFLVRMEDVTSRILKKADAAGEGERELAIAEEIEAIIAEATEGNDYNAKVKDMFYGNEFYLFVTETFRDVRLVGAPPSSIGKFGGDTDNWMWPRHTGDFGILRVYAGPDNKPADYSPDNKPYKPKHYLPISIKGYQEGDFSMIMGYPGSTDRYLTSFEIENIYSEKNPDYINLMNQKLEIMKADMDKSAAVRISLASSYASLANYYKYCVGQNRGLRKRGLQEERAELEAKFTKWVNQDPKRKEKYGQVIAQIDENIKSGQKIQKLMNYLNFAGFGPDFISMGIPYWRLKRAMDDGEGKETEEDKWASSIEMIKGGLDESFEGYIKETDEKVFANSVRLMKEDLPEEYHMDVFKGKTFTKKAKAKKGMGKYEAYANHVFENSIVMNKEAAEAFLEKPSLKALQKDPGLEYISSLLSLFIAKAQPINGMVGAEREELMRIYMKGLMEMQKDRVFYPDANSTLRLTYGRVASYVPRDGVKYGFYTTQDGIWEKETPGDEEFEVPQKLLDLIEKKDFGRYGKNGQLNVCVLTNHDITGGNSGSPLINAEGHLIGIAFDGNWESMTSDLVFDDDIVRTISVDARYVLFIIDKYAGAKNLIKELDIRG